MLPLRLHIISLEHSGLPIDKDTNNIIEIVIQNYKTKCEGQNMR